MSRSPRLVALLERLEAAGWVIEFEGVDDGIAEYAALRKFASPVEALDAAPALGAEGRMFEWPGEHDYFCVDDWSRQELLKRLDEDRDVVHVDQLSMF